MGIAVAAGAMVVTGAVVIGEAAIETGGADLGKGGADFSINGRAAVARIKNPFRRANEIKEFAGGFLESLRRSSDRLVRG
jgi:hypothetical protein